MLFPPARFFLLARYAALYSSSIRHIHTFFCE